MHLDLFVEPDQYWYKIWGKKEKVNAHMDPRTLESSQA